MVTKVYYLLILDFRFKKYRYLHLITCKIITNFHPYNKWTIVDTMPEKPMHAHHKYRRVNIEKEIKWWNEIMEKRKYVISEIVILTNA